MSVLAAPLALAAALLALAGLAKLRAPEATAVTLSRLGLPGWVPAVAVARLIGTVEVALASACLLAPSTASAGALALAYAAFALAMVALAAGEASSIPCGCFGAGSFEPTRAHAGFDLLAAVVALAAALNPPPGPLEWFGDPLAGVAAAAALACSVWLAYLIFTLVPNLWSAAAR